MTVGGRWLSSPMTALAHQPHRVTRAVTGVRDQLASVSDVPLCSMDANETAATIEDLVRAEGQLAELKSRLLVQAEAVDLAGHTGATSTANWLSHHAKVARPGAHRAVRLAHGLDAHEQTRAAMAEGKVQAEQALVIMNALD